jgi:aspartate-semialdehyde dehydrogenase
MTNDVQLTRAGGPQRYRVGVLGATGMVGQNYLRLLENHPWFEVTYVAASPRSAGQSYAGAVDGRWQMATGIPVGVHDLIVGDANQVDQAQGQCDFVFSALEMDKQAVRDLEDAYASAGLSVVSNASAHRHTDDVPMLIPEINPHHLDILESQKERHGGNGFVAVKPNCSLQSYLTPIHALQQAGYKVEKMILTTMQAVSGAGYPGVPSLDMIDNVVPYIGGEEEKSEREPQKILGTMANGKFVYDTSIAIAAHCNRVPVIDGHTACVSVKFADKVPSMEEIKKIWTEFKGVPQGLDLPSAPVQPIHYREEANRPQPRKDRDADKGMAVTVGRLRECPVFDIRFVGLSHNTVRGAAGGGILNAELLVAKDWL